MEVTTVFDSVGDDAKSLSTLIEDAIMKKIRIEEGIVWAVMLQLLQALSHLHKKGVAHRSLRPACCYLSKTSTTSPSCTIQLGEVTSPKLTAAIAMRGPKVRVCLQEHFASDPRGLVGSCLSFTFSNACPYSSFCIVKLFILPPHARRIIFFTSHSYNVEGSVCDVYFLFLHSPLHESPTIEWKPRGW